MIEVRPQGKIVEKIVRTKTGWLVLAVFFVTEREGEISVRLLSVRPVPERITNCELRTTNGGNYLTGECRKPKAAAVEVKPRKTTTSPYFNIFEFFVSQPTRAPSRA